MLRNEHATKLKIIKSWLGNSGRASTVVLTIFGLVVSTAMVMYAMDAELKSAESKTGVQTVAGAATNAAGQDQAVSPAELSGQDYAAMMEKDFVRMEDKYAAATPPDTGIGGDNGPATPPLDQAFPSDMIPANDDTAVKIDEILSLAPTLELDDPTGGQALGKAALGVYQGWTFLKLAAIDLPSLPAGESYVAWLQEPVVGQSISAGRLDYNATTSQAVLYFDEPRDLSAYRTVFVARQANGAVVPNKVIISGQFPTDAAFTITTEDIMSARGTSTNSMPGN